MDANIALMMISDKIPSQSLTLVQEKLKNSSEDKINNITTLNFKSHIVGLIFRFLFGYFWSRSFL